MVLGAYAETLENTAGVGFGLIAPQFRVLRLKLSGLDPILISEVLFLVESVHLLANVIEILVAHEHRIHDSVSVILVLVLLQDGHAGVGQNGHLAGGGFQRPGQNFQEGGFARPIGANDPIAIALDKLQVHMGKQWGAGIVEGEVGNGYHSAAPYL